MNVLDTMAQTRKTLDDVRASGRTVGFVPTMGALHAGHPSLMDRARRESHFTVVSIFVNPVQFGPHEDFNSYPRPFEDDLDACRQAGVDLVFAPAPHEMYPAPSMTRVSVSGVSEPLEGAHRPGHFDGVALVVTKLFNVIGPCRAYFGQKDVQQLAVIRRMTSDLDLPVEVVPCATVRDADGLALSSRNAYLSPEERLRASALPRALFAVRDLAASGEAHVAKLLDRGREILAEGNPDGVDYLACVDPETFEPVEVLGEMALVCAAVRFGRTRLIDNVVVTGGSR